MWSMPAMSHRALAAAIEMLEPRLLFFGLGPHEEITRAALGFLNSSVLATIVDQHPTISPYGTASFSRSGHQVKVTFPGGVTFPGIISGSWEQEKLPDNIEVHHDYLNKDYPDRPWFTPARDLALKQSKHEFTR